MTEEKELTKESCYIEPRNVTNNIARIIALAIDKSRGIPVEDQLEGEITELTANNLRFKRCILRDSGFRKAHETEMKSVYKQ